MPDGARRGRDSAVHQPPELQNAAAPDATARGFSYAEWIKKKRPWHEYNIRANEHEKFHEPSSFWHNFNLHLHASAKSKVRDSLRTILPSGGEACDIVLRYGNGGEFNMREWRKLRQERLAAEVKGLPFALVGESERILADAISQQATQRLEFVRRARIDFRTPLGGRAGQLGAEVAGALRETDDDVVGWQLRAYGGEEQKTGGNAGLFWRVASGEHLFGANIFTDYENDDDFGGFWRWSIGAEWKSRYGEVSANRYWAITDGKELSDGRVAYTREGFDADAYLRAPGVEWLSAKVGYYKWQGEHGDKDDDGLRYGLRAQPGKGLELEVNYDAGGSEWGGEFSYSRTIGEPEPAAARAATFDPRAHSEKIQN